MLEQGYIKLHRAVLDWEWYGDINVSRLFIHLLLTANHRDGRWRGMEIMRGQRVTSVAKLSEETALSQKQVRNALAKLSRTGELARKSTNRYTILTLVNYGRWQGAGGAPTGGSRSEHPEPTHGEPSAQRAGKPMTWEGAGGAPTLGFAAGETSGARAPSGGRQVAWQSQTPGARCLRTRDAGDAGALQAGGPRQNGDPWEPETRCGGTGAGGAPGGQKAGALRTTKKQSEKASKQEQAQGAPSCRDVFTDGAHASQENGNSIGSKDKIYVDFRAAKCFPCDNDAQVEADVRRLAASFAGNGFGAANPAIRRAMAALLREGMEAALIERALREAAESGAASWRYAKRILERCRQQGITKAAAFDAQKRCSSRDMSRRPANGVIEAKFTPPPKRGGPKEEKP